MTTALGLPDDSFASDLVVIARHSYPWNDGWPADALEATKQPYEETTREEMLVKFCACIRCAFLPSAYSNKTVVDGPRFDGKQVQLATDSSPADRHHSRRLLIAID